MEESHYESVQGRDGASTTPSQTVPCAGNPCYDLVHGKSNHKKRHRRSLLKLSPSCLCCSALIIFLCIIVSTSLIVAILSFMGAERTDDPLNETQLGAGFDAQLIQMVNRINSLENQSDTFKHLLSGHHQSFPAVSCSEIAQISPSPSSGYYWTRSHSNGSALQVYCDMLSLVGIYQTFPASSCSQISSVNSLSPSSYYWIRVANGSVVRVHCDAARFCSGGTGSWARVANLRFTNGSDPCPVGLREQNDSDIRTCRSNSSAAGCSSVKFDTHGISYNKVCGKILAYQYHHTDAFGTFFREENGTIDSNYVDGVSLTHGRNPRQHIWTFAAALDELGSVMEGIAVCPCSHPRLNELPLPSFIGQDYFCDSGVRGSYFYRIPDPFYTQDPLWDGDGCGPNVTCCSFNNPPWFRKQLPSPTVDNIEMRVCRDEESWMEDIAVASVRPIIQ